MRLPMAAGGEPQPSVLELLRRYADVMDALRVRKVVRSSNNPVADYTELLVCFALQLERTTKSSAGHDAVDAAGLRYQIKGRRLTPQNRSTELSAIRKFDTKPFDFLVAVVFHPDFSVDYAAQIPATVVDARAGESKHTNSRRFLFTRRVLSDPGVIDITERLTGLSV